MTKILKVGDLRGKPDQMGDRIYSTKGISPTLAAQRGNNSKGSILITDLTQPQSKKSQQTLFPTTIYSLAVSLAKHFPLLEKEGDLTTQEELYSLTSHGFSKRNSQDSSYWKTSKDCYLITMEELSKPSSPRLLNWGMISNGKCLTQRISESPRIGKECSLSDILEENPDPKYFLSEKLIQGFINKKKIFSQRFNPLEKQGISPTLTSRYWKQGATDPYLYED